MASGLGLSPRFHAGKEWNGKLQFTRPQMVATLIAN